MLNMTELSSQSLFLRALQRQPVERTPIWIMRQAGRYLPEYRALRAKNPDFLSFCKTPELACEATLQPLKRFPLDAAIIFSDILTVADAMGAGLEFVENKGPVIQKPVRSYRDLIELQEPNVDESLAYVFKAIQYTQRELNGKTPLIGFAGSPWTLATYLVEGGVSKAFRHIKTMQFRNPKLLKELLQKITEITIAYLNAQAAAGVDALMLFDSWGGLLSREDYQIFSLQYLSEIARACQHEKNGRKIPLIVYTKNSTCFFELAENYQAIGVDWTVDLGAVRSMVKDRVALQGNMDPFTLFASAAEIRASVQNIFRQYGEGNGHIFNLGHGIDQDTPIESVETLIEAVHEFGKISIPTA
jgi:uroporphyrinogen decarboxylase